MATYKKRGGKPRTKVEKDQDIEDGSATAEVFNSLDEGASRTEAWIEKNQKIILGFIGTVVVCVLGFLAFQEFVQNPKEIEATNEMFQAQTYFEQALTAPAKDSLFNLALNGGEGKYGFIDMVENFGSTKAGNLSKYYAGMAYLNTNKYKEAINYLDDFSSDDAIIGPLAKGGIGDAFVQLGQEDKALAYYETAASMNKNDFTSPRFLLKAGTTALNIGKKEKAIKHFTEIIEKYPNATEVAKATANIGKANAMN